MREQKWFLLGTLGFMVAVLVGVLVTTGWTQVVWAFVLGGMSVALVFTWMLGFDARSLKWQWGAAGEIWTAEELQRLGKPWRVFHDLPDGNGKGNLDHVAAGLPGVFTIDSKNWSAPATVGEDGLKAGGLRADGAKSRGSAVRLKELLERETGVSAWVQGVVAVWGGMPEDVVERHKVIYLRAPGHVDQLERQRNRLSEEELGLVVEALDRLQRGTN